MNKRKKITIGPRALGVFAGKIEDRLSGTNMQRDVYLKIARQSTRHEKVIVELTADECLELCEEIDFAINPRYGRDRYIHPESDDDRAEVRSLRRLYNRLDEAATELLGPAPDVSHLRVVK
jgi:hypothetical protein